MVSSIDVQWAGPTRPVTARALTGHRALLAGPPRASCLAIGPGTALWAVFRAVCDTPALGLIELIGYLYQQVATSFSEANLERTLKLNVLGLEQFRDG